MIISVFTYLEKSTFPEIQKKALEVNVLYIVHKTFNIEVLSPRDLEESF